MSEHLHGPFGTDRFGQAANRRDPRRVQPTVDDAMSQPIVVADRGEHIAFSFQDMLKYHGPGSPGGVAHAFKVLHRALGSLGRDGPLQRRELTVHTAFAGPCARDGFELVTRAVTESR